MPASIFAGSKVKTLKSTLSLNGGADIISSTTNPQTSAVSAEPGSLLLNTTSGTMYRKLDAGSTTNWVEVGAGTGGKNYIKNPDFDGGATTSWSMQKVSLSSFIPTGNIGAADAGHTIATSGSSPLEGANSLLVQGASAFTAGNCLVSAAFAIDREDVAKVMGWSFSYEAITTNMDFSGTTGNTWAVYIAEVTTGTPDTVVSWIQPAGVYNLVQGSGVGLAAGTFQTTATESSAYRIVLVCINSEAAATTLKVDDFQLGPQRVVYGSPVTDWQSFTPTPVGFTASAIEGKYRRVGDSIEVRIRAVMATVTSGAFSVSAPFPADSTKYPSAAVNSFYGTGGYYDTTANQGYIGTSFITSGVSPVIGVYGPAGSQWQASGVPVAFGAGDILTVEITYPAAGLSSSVQMSNDTDTRVVAARIEKNGNQASITSDVVLTTWSVSHDTTASWDVVNNKYTFPVSGVYKIDGIGTFDNVAGTSRVLQYRINGGSWQRFTEIISSGASNFTICTVNTQLSVSAGSYIEFGAASGTSVAFRGNSATTPSWFNINRLSGPATIAASETVAMARVISSVISVPTNVSTPLNFQYTGPTPEPVDTHNAYRLGAGYNPALGTWTTIPGYVVPVSGVYNVSATLLLSGAATNKQLFITKNAAQFASTANDNTFANFFPLTTSGIVRCNAGDILGVYYFHNTGSNVNVPATTTAAWSTFNVERIGS